MRHEELDPLEAPPLPSWAVNAPRPQVRVHADRVAEQQLRKQVDPFDVITLDPTEAPPLPDSVTQHDAEAPTRREVRAHLERVVHAPAPVTESEDWVLVAVGLGVACSMLTLLLMVFTG